MPLGDTRRVGDKDVSIYQHVFAPDLVDPKSVRLETSEEQNLYIRAILDVACSDTQFSEKAYRAILKVLDGNKPPVEPPLVPEAPLTGYRKSEK
jgi:hypothetical protein